MLQKNLIIGTILVLSCSIILSNNAFAEKYQINIIQGSAAKECFSCYQPSTLKVGKGDTVTWENNDNTFHTVTSKNTKNSQGNFDSGHIKPEGIFSFTFRANGEFPYGCMIHPWMKGELSVSSLQTYPDFTWSDETIYYDTNNLKIEQPIVGKKVSIQKEIHNVGAKDSGIALFMLQIKQNNVLIHEETVKRSLASGKSSILSFSWIPLKVGTYQVIFNADYGRMTGEINIANNISVSSIIVSDEISIPSWIKDNARWWNQGTIDDKEFAKGIRFLISKNAFSENELPMKNSNQKIPVWFKNNAKWWAEGKISDKNFIDGLKFLNEKSIISV